MEPVRGFASEHAALRAVGAKVQADAEAVRDAQPTALLVPEIATAVAPEDAMGAMGVLVRVIPIAALLVPEAARTAMDAQVVTDVPVAVTDAGHVQGYVGLTAREAARLTADLPARADVILAAQSLA